MQRIEGISKIILLLILGISVYFSSLFLKVEKQGDGYQVQPDINFDYNYEQFFPESDDHLSYFKNYRDQYESDSDFLLLGIKHAKGLLDPVFVQKVTDLTEQLKGVDHVLSVVSPSNLKYAKLSSLGVLQQKLYYPVDADSSDLSQIYNHSFLVGNFFSPNQQSISLYLKTTPELSRAKSLKLIDDLKGLVQSYEFDETHLAGRVMAQIHFVSKMGMELALFMSISILILIVFLWLTFRSWYGIIVPLFVVLLSILWTMAIMDLTGKAFDMLTMLLPTILFVVGMSDVVHIFSKYLEELRKGQAKLTALKVAFKEVSIATFLTSFTTSIGFFTLLMANIEPIRDFGLYCGIGVFVAYFLAFTLLPAVLIQSKAPESKDNLKNHLTWERIMRTMFLFVLKKRKMIVAVTGLIIVLSVGLLYQVKINNYLLEDLSESDPVKRDARFFENEFSGVRPFELAVNVQTDLNDPLTWKTLDSLENYLASEYGVGSIVSYLSVIKSVNQAMSNGKSKYYSVPRSDKKIEKILNQIDQLKNDSINNVLSKVIDWDQKQLRIHGRIADIGAIKVRAKNEELANVYEEKGWSKVFSYRLTGTANLIDQNNEYLASKMMSSLVVAFLVVALIAGIFYKSWKMTIIALIPNILPLVMIAAVMGAFDIYLRITTSLIFTIAFGIAVDDTIHFLSRLKIELNAGRSYLYAIKRSFLSTGKAIIMTSFMLSAGFFCLVFSNFMSTFFIGVLVSLTLLFAVVVDLILLPVLLIWWYKPKAIE